MTHPVLKRALNTWGERVQMLMVVEEMSELTKEILKNISRGKNNISELIEETADVEIMLEQLKENYQIIDQVSAYKADKIKLIEQRLNDWDKK